MLKRTTAITAAGVIFTLVALLTVLPTPDAPEPAVDALVIDNARYFDGERMRDAAAITIRDGRIDAIDAAGGGPAGAATRIDASGKTLLPGLIDAHVHTFATAQRDAVTFGVTTLIDMFTSPTLLEGARSARDDFGPSNAAALFSAGMLATVEGGHGTQYGILMDTLAGPEDAPDWVAARVAEGSDFIKLVYMPYAPMPSLDLETATAVIESAHEAGLLAVAHVSSLEGARELLGAGIDGFVHVFADKPADDDFISRAVARGVFVVPTLAVIAMVNGKSTGPALVDDPNLGPQLTPAAAANLRQSFGVSSPLFSLDVALDNVRRLHEAGVPILAGSDAPNPGTAHGATVHAEIELLVRAGLSETEALAAATSLPAKHFGTEGRGRIVPGARADLVLVEGDPSSDIMATRAIERVYRNGYPVGDEAAPAAETETALVVAGVLGDFDEGTDAPEGLLWSETSDTMMGGSSTASIERVARGDGGALAVTTRVGDGFAFPWAGAYLGPAAEGIVGDLGDASAIAFEVRGTPASYRLMLFVSGGMGAPPTAEFAVTPDWQRVEIALDTVRGFEPDRFGGMAFVTPMRGGDYTFEIDNVTVVP